MRRQIRFWYVTLARGFLALLFGSAIWVVPDMAGSLLLLPLAVAVTVLALAAYGVLDSLLVFLSSTMTRSRRAAVALGIQGMVGIIVWSVIFAALYESVTLEWFFLLAGIQALCVGATEIVVAHHTRNRHKTLWSYGAAGVAFGFGCSYLLLWFSFGQDLAPRMICWFIYGYLLAMGFFQCMVGALMLHREHHRRRLTGQLPAGARIYHAESAGSVTGDLRSQP